MLTQIDSRYDLGLTAACIRGMLGKENPALLEKPLDALTEADIETLLALAREQGIKLHYFKHQETLPRVRMALGFLKGIQPDNLLDVGSGRGVFLFPLLRTFPELPVTCTEISPSRADLLEAVSRGGFSRLSVRREDICAFDAPEGSFDAVTLLEVLEHIPDVEAAVRNAVRLSRRYVVITVPSKPDNNPEHIHLLTKPVLEKWLREAGCEQIQFSGVPGHLFCAAGKNRG